MLQASIPNVLFVSQTYVASVLSECCICFTHMLQEFYVDVVFACNGFQVFSGVLQVFQMYVVSVSVVSDVCCKSRSGVAHVAMGSTCGRFVSVLDVCCKCFI
jgi:hypothetical protein